MTKRNFIAWSILIVFLCLPAYVIWDSLSKIENIGKQIFDEYTFLDMRNTQGAKISRLKTEYDRLEPSLPKLAGLVIAPGEEINFVTSVETTAAQHRVNQTLNLNINNIAQSASLEKIPLTLLLQGRYRDVVSTIAALHSLPAAIIIKRIELNPVFNNQTADTSALIDGYVFRTPKSSAQ